MMVRQLTVHEHEPWEILLVTSGSMEKPSGQHEEENDDGILLMLPHAGSGVENSLATPCN